MPDLPPDPAPAATPPTGASPASDERVTLALDTATPHLTLALRWPSGERAVSREVGRAHAETLAAATAELFDSAGLPLRADLIVLGTGPGSYTGVRVGASYALGLARVWGAGVLGVSTLEGLIGAGLPHAQTPSEHPTPEQSPSEQAVSLDARKGNVYGAVYAVQGGTVVATLHPPARRPAEEFRALAAGRLHRHDAAPDGLALLRAGLRHGARDWTLAYL